MERRHLECGLTVDVAVTHSDWEHGLAGISSSSSYWDEVDGMLFCFDAVKCWAITTSKTLRTIYGYWLDEHERVVAMQPMTPESTVLYVPLTAGKYLLETIRPMDWQLGQRVRVRAYEPTRHADADSGTAQRFHHESAVLDHQRN